MRQAGRFLPEYREIRSRHGMLDVIRTPKLAAEVTLQPLRRFDLDGAIIFADILNPLIGMGIDLDFVAGEGPKIFNPVRNRDDVARLAVPRAEDNVPYTLEAIGMVSSELRPRGVPLLGFAGAPFTLSAYMIEGEGFSQPAATKKLMIESPSVWNDLQAKLCEMLCDYLAAQARAGAAALQIFDSWVGQLGPAEFGRFVLPHLAALIRSLRERTDVPLIYFSTGSAALFSSMKELDVDAFGVDWRQDLATAQSLLGARALQGNLDPVLLLSPGEYLERAALDVLRAGRSLPAHVFNLGHGILPGTQPETVARLVEIVRGFRE